MYSERFNGVHILAKYHTLSFFNVRQRTTTYIVLMYARTRRDNKRYTFGIVRVFEH